MHDHYLKKWLGGIGEEDVEGEEIVKLLLLNLLVVEVPDLGDVLLPPRQHLVQVKVPEI